MNDSTTLVGRFNCGLTPAILQAHQTSSSNSNQAGLLAVGSFPASATETCGHFIVYYEDLLSTMPTAGFSDPSVGSTRRSTFCAVLTYAQNTFDFSAMGPSDYIRLYILQSYAPAGLRAPIGTTYAAYAAAFYNSSTTGYTYGYPREYINTGTDPFVGNYHATFHVNFDGVSTSPTIVFPLNYYDGTGTIPTCAVDLFTVLLHEVGHSLGWFSLLQVPAPTIGSALAAYNGLTPQSIISTGNEFSGLDSSLEVGRPGLPFTKVILPSSGGLIINPSALVNADNNYWINNLNAPDNYPVFAGALTMSGVDGTASYFSHLDKQPYTFSAKERLSRGDNDDYCMGPYLWLGLTHREFTKAEIQSFVRIMKYNLTSSFTSTHPNTMGNHTPYSTRMAGYPDDYWKLHMMYEEQVPADFPVLTNTGASLTLNLSTDATLVDPDGDPISIYPNSVVNIRGCGNGGNNSNQLVVNSAGTTITYTPRHNFYGRAQFGFNLYDGKEKGAFVVYTIDVATGSNVSTPPGTNIVLNGDFEEGTQTSRLGTDEPIPNLENRANSSEERRFGGSMLGDSHPYNFLGCGGSFSATGSTSTLLPGPGVALPLGFAYGIGLGDVVDNLFYDCPNVTVLPYIGNHPINSSNSTISSHPAPANNTGKRYGTIANNGISASPIQGEFFYLGDNLLHCQKYTLEFDARMPVGAPPPTTFTMIYAMNVSFLSNGSSINWFAPSFNYSLPTTATTITVNNTTWQHISIPFYYCAATPSNVLYLDLGAVNSFSLYGTMDFDNLSIVEDLSSNPILATVIQTLIAPCQIQLAASTVSGLACSPISYIWKNSSGTVIGTGAKLFVPATVASYTLETFNGCITSTMNVSTAATAPVLSVAANPGTTICSGSSTTLTASLPGSPSGFTYSWSPATGLSCTTCTSPTASPTSTTTYTVTATGYGCSSSASVTVIVNPTPVVNVFPVSATVCQGSSVVLTASGATSYDWSTSPSGPVIATGATYTASPVTSTVYFVTGTTNGCTNTISVPILVTPISITATAVGSNTICLGQSVTLTATASGPIAWTPPTGLSATTGPIVIATPTATTTYTATTTNGSCVATAPVTITVATPSILATASPSIICAGNNSTLSATGAVSYVWSPATGLSSTTGASVTASPPTTTTYTVTGTTSSGCTGTSTVTLTVSPAPVASITATPSTTVGATLTAVPTSATTYSYAWFDPSGLPVAVSSSTTSITATMVGTYTVTITDLSPPNCTSTATVAITTVCPAFASLVGSYTTLTGSLTTSPPPGAYYIPATLTISGNVTFNNSYVLMAPNSAIIVNGHKLFIQNTHLATCPGTTDMWQGINLLGDNPEVHVLGTNQGSSIIEDAIHAISINSPGLWLYSNPGGYIETNDAIFNRNQEAIYISNITNNPYLSYRFRFVNTVFTSRDLASSFISWPNVSLLKGLGVPAGWDPMAPPYVLNANYSKANLKNGSPALIGIHLDNAGYAAVNSNSITGYDLNGVEIGDETFSGFRNVFDNFRGGIESYNSSLQVKNCSFTEMPFVGGWGGMGVYSWTNPTNGTIRRLLVGNSPSPNIATRNEFYENHQGVEAAHNYIATISGALIRSTNRILATGGIGQIGIRMEGPSFLSWRADSNIIQNCVNGIALIDWGGSTLKGNEWVRYNNISCDKTALYTNQNIAIQLSGSGGPVVSAYTGNVSNNNINSVYNGIVVNNFWGRTTYTYNNKVGPLLHDKNRVQFGINSSATGLMFTSYNNVSGSSNANDNARAYYFASSFAQNIGCNVENTIGRGFEFANAQASTFWHQNTMQDNGKGLVVGGAIGAQGNAVNGNKNQWLPAGSWLLGGAQIQTIANAYNPNPGSILYVASNSAENPLYNSQIASGTAYGSGSIILTTGASLTGACGIAPPSPSYRMALESVAQDSLPPSPSANIEIWLAQRQLFRTLLVDTAVINASSILQAFFAVALPTRFGWLSQLDDAVNAGDDNQVNTLINTIPAAAGIVTGPNGVVVKDMSDADGILQIYLSYYDLWRKWHTGVMSSTDTSDLEGLANLCPMRDGYAVYMARTLQQIVSGDVIVYNDNCLENPGGGNARMLRNNFEQEYSLYPNPNNGEMQLTQALTLDGVVGVKVYSTIGSLVRKGEVLFSRRFAALKVGELAPGLYHIVLRQQTGENYHLQFLKK